MNAAPFDPDQRLLPSGPAGELADAERRARYRFAARFAEGRSVLDAGCGTGDGAVALSRAGARSVLGLDVSRHVIAAAERREPTPGAAPLRFEHGDLLAGALPAESFGLIACFGVLDELADLGRACGELLRVLSEDGVVVASTASEEVRAALAGEFPHSLELSQGSGLATLIAANPDGGADGELGGDVSAGEASRVPSPTRIVIGARRPIEAPAALTLHAGGVEAGAWLASLTEWEQRARRAEAELAAASIEIGYLTELLEDLSSRRKRGVIRSRFARPRR